MKKRGLRTEEIEEIEEEVEEQEGMASDTRDLEETPSLAFGEEEKEEAVKTRAEPLSLTKPETIDKLAQWLEERKSEWKSMRDARRQDRLRASGSRSSSHQYGLTTSQILFGTSSLTPTAGEADSRKRRVGIDELVKNAARAITHGLWQIVELQETDSPGIFIAWSFTGASQLQKLFINIPRIIYVNCRGGRAELTARELGGRIVKKDLPHGRPVHNLYEIQLQEHKYLKNERALGLFLCDPLVEGVYETRAPLSYRAILRLGCIATVTGGAGGEGREGLSASSAFRLKDLKFVNGSSERYLETDSASYKRIFLYHTEDNRRSSGVGVVALFIVSENNSGASGNTSQHHLSDSRPFTAKAWVWLVQPRGVVERPPMQRIFRRFCVDERNICKFTTASVATMSSAFAACNEILAAYVRERRGPTIAIAQSKPSLSPSPLIRYLLRRSHRSDGYKSLAQSSSPLASVPCGDDARQLVSASAPSLRPPHSPQER